MKIELSETELKTVVDALQDRVYGFVPAYAKTQQFKEQAEETIHSLHRQIKQMQSNVVQPDVAVYKKVTEYGWRK